MLSGRCGDASLHSSETRLRKTKECAIDRSKRKKKTIAPIKKKKKYRVETRGLAPRSTVSDSAMLLSAAHRPTWLGFDLATVRVTGCRHCTQFAPITPHLPRMSPCPWRSYTFRARAVGHQFCIVDLSHLVCVAGILTSVNSLHTMLKFFTLHHLYTFTHPSSSACSVISASMILALISALFAASLPSAV